MRALVTGGAGFIGSHISRHLIARGDSVKILDNLSTGSRENLPPEAVFIEGDLRDNDLLKQVIVDLDVIFHLAAFTSVPLSFTEEALCRGINQEGFKSLLRYAGENNVRRVVYSSSSAVYPDDIAEPVTERHVPKPSSPYGDSKLFGEGLLRSWQGEKDGRGATAFRYFNVYGPRQEPDSDYASVIPKFMKQIAAGAPLSIYGTGNQTRDYVYVQDVVAANYLASGLDGFQILNVGTGVETSVNELAGMLESLAGKSVEKTRHPLPPGDAVSSRADVSALVSRGWASAFDLKRGLDLTWQAFPKAKGPLSGK